MPKGDHRSSQTGMFRLDLPRRKWIHLSGQGAVSGSERNALVYDSKRDRLVLLVGRGDAAMHEWPVSAGKPKWAGLPMTGQPPKTFAREAVYVPKSDRIVCLTPQGLYDCDLAGGNRWRKLLAEPQGTVIHALLYDAELDVMVMLFGKGSGSVQPVNVWLMRYDPAGWGK